MERWMFEYDDIIIVLAFSICISLIFYGISFYLKRQQKRGKTLTKQEEVWMDISKFAAISFLFLPIIIMPLVWISDVFFNILIVIVASLAVLSMMKQRK